ncbi:MAG TPA: peroxiredoxin, partial [Polyangiaceae bacterium]|nr:peroxiredoxin [Polyangiaceae bacterium]
PKASKAKPKASKAKPKAPKASKAKPKASKAKPKAPKASKAKPKAMAKPTPSVSAKIATPAAAKPVQRVSAGDRAPSFSLRDQSGANLSSESLAGKPYVLYFYPRDDTTGCTAEACNFRDSGPRFGERGVRIIGVSPDGQESHARFASKHGLPFTLLSDPEKELAHAYGVWVEKQNYGRKYMGIERSTFLVSGDGKVRKAWRGVRVPGHIESVLEASDSL